MARLKREDFLALAGTAGRRAVMTRRSAAVHAERAPCPVMLLRRDGRRGQPVSVLYEGEESTLTLGRDLARVYESPLLVLIAGEGEAALAQREAKAGRWLAASGTAGVAQRIAAQESEGIGRLLCEVDADLVVVDQRAAIGGQAGSRRPGRADPCLDRGPRNRLMRLARVPLAVAVAAFGLPGGLCGTPGTDNRASTGSRRPRRFPSRRTAG